MRIPRLIAIAMLCGTAGQAPAQLLLIRQSVDGGGGHAANGELTLGATIGQADAGRHASGGLELGGGFWFGGAALATGIDDPVLRPALQFALHPTHPNPFNPATTIAFDLPEMSRVELRIYNLRGELVTTLIDGERSAGRYRMTWHGRDERGKAVASGVYLLQLTTGTHTARQKITMLR